MKKTAVIGATPNPRRYAFVASKMLQNYNHEVVPIGIKTGQVSGIDILNIREKPEIEDIHTITLYIGPPHQPEWYDYLLSLNPKRIIFNPGTENSELVELAEAQGIEATYACTLVLLRLGSY
jgi:predicted CoA-binding protein